MRTKKNKTCPTTMSALIVMAESAARRRPVPSASASQLMRVATNASGTAAGPATASRLRNLPRPSGQGARDRVVLVVLGMCQDAGCIGLTNAFRASAGVRAIQRDKDRQEEEDCANRQYGDKRKGEAGQRDRVGISAVPTHGFTLRVGARAGSNSSQLTRARPPPAGDADHNPDRARDHQNICRFGYAFPGGHIQHEDAEPGDHDGSGNEPAHGAKLKRSATKPDRGGAAV